MTAKAINKVYTDRDIQGKPKNNLRYFRILLYLLLLSLSGLILLLIFFLSDHPTIRSREITADQTLMAQSWLKNTLHSISRHGQVIRIEEKELALLRDVSQSIYPKLNWRLFLVKNSYILRTSFQVGSQGASRFLNIDIAGKLNFKGDHKDMDIEYLKIKDKYFSGWLVNRLLGKIFIAYWMDLQSHLPELRSAAIQNSQLVLAVEPFSDLSQLPKLLPFNSHQQTEITVQSDGDMVQEAYANIIELLEHKPPEEDSFSLIIKGTFRFVRDLKNRGNTSIAGNRIAIKALARFLGPVSVTKYLFPQHQGGHNKKQLEKLRDETRFYDRKDLARHFIVSALLTTVLNDQLSNLIGLKKETMDFNTSGFSFADLMADRSGAAFSRLLLSDEVTAEGIQKDISENLVINEFMPNPEGLPENLTADKFRKEFGSTTSDKFMQLLEKIDAQIYSLKRYQAIRP
ncbi:MAG: hypothetical protein GY786_25370 [Proteobacteria bacterium]|nr:hypothetical protein [Pseudomonadota bacterium]